MMMSDGAAGGGNTNQFIGSKISLISKSEIRYEGILYSLDLEEATISLQKGQLIYFFNIIVQF